MKHYFIFTISIFYISLVVGQNQKATSFNPGQLWKDDKGLHINAHGGGLLFEKGIYYWYGEHKTEGKSGNLAQVGVHCYSSKDLYNWNDMGIVLAIDPENSKSEIEKGCIIERPKVIYNKKKRKYVMWFHLELKGKGYDAARAAVAISDKPTGPFNYIRSWRPNAGIWPINITENEKKDQPKTEDKLQNIIQGEYLRRDFKEGQMSRDMTLFQDQDKAYLVYSAENNFTLNIAELDENYTGFTGKWLRLFPGGHNEAPALFKKDGKYYLFTSGCTGWDPNEARSAVSSRIWGPWKELGNPALGNDADLTFHSQSTFILPVEGKKDAFIFMADRWNPKNAIDGRYIWLPIMFENEKPIIRWSDSWTLKQLNNKK